MRHPRSTAAVVAWLLGLLTTEAGAVECLTSSGVTACGFHCISAESQVRCAQTPDGVCSSSSGVVACWDPPIDTPAVAYDPAAERACLAGSDGRVCGFRCLATARATGCGAERRDVCRVDGESRRVVCASPN